MKGVKNESRLHHAAHLLAVQKIHSADNSDKLEVIEVDEMCRRSSIFGNAFFKITKEQLKALEDGKVLFNLGEYGTFIMLEK